MMTLLLPLLIAATVCPAPRSLVLVGRWESRDTSKGGIGNVIEFHTDGTFVQALTIIVNLAYAVSGDQLTVAKSPEEKPAPETAVHFKADATSFVRRAADGSETFATRVGRPDAGTDAIVGSWRYRHYSGAIAFEHYTSDGKLAFRLPMTSSVGCYDVEAEGHDVTISNTSGGSHRLWFDTAKDELNVKSADKSWSYSRTDQGNWYDIEHIDYLPPKSQQ
jgi:hypothetical protein